MLLMLGACRDSSTQQLRFPNAPVFLISIDTLRSDRLPAYGYRGVETPHLDALAADSVVFESAFSHVPLTLPSHASLFTGRLPHQHGVRNNVGYRLDGDANPTLASILRSAGYRTGAAVSAYVLRAETGLSDGFEGYDDRIADLGAAALGTVERHGRQTVARAAEWLRTPRAGAPEFFFLHLFEPHAPYAPSAASAALYDDPYDGEIADVDAILGDFLALLKSYGLYEKSIVCLFSDHGEGLGDHGVQEHGLFVYREAIQVPLVMKLPQQRLAGRRVAALAQLIDILPTITGLVGIEAPAALTGVSLLDLVADESRFEQRAVYSETYFPRLHLGWSELRSLLTRERHFIDAPQPELYRWREDRREEIDVMASERATGRRLRAELGAYDAALEPPAPVGDEERKRLEALGYVGTAKSVAGTLPDPKLHVAELERLQRAFRLAAVGEREQAVVLLEELVDDNPGLMDGWSKLALTLEELGRLETALAAYRQALEHDSTFASSFALSMASLSLKLGRADEALRLLPLAAAEHPARSRLLEAQVALETGRLDAAEGLLQGVIDHPQQRWSALLLLARIRAAQGEWLAGLETVEVLGTELRQAEAPPLEGLEFVRGDLLGHLDRLAEAEAAFVEEIRLFPRHLQAYANLAVVYRVSGRPAAATAILERMVSRVDTAAAYRLAAETAETLGDRTRAASYRRHLSD